MGRRSVIGFGQQRHHIDRMRQPREFRRKSQRREFLGRTHLTASLRNHRYFQTDRSGTAFVRLHECLPAFACHVLTALDFTCRHDALFGQEARKLWYQRAQHRKRKGKPSQRSHSVNEYIPRTVLQNTLERHVAAATNRRWSFRGPYGFSIVRSWPPSCSRTNEVVYESFDRLRWVD